MPRLKGAAAVIALVALQACSDATAPAISGPWAQVSAGSRFTCALDTQGAAWCWGSGVFGQLGNNATANQVGPVPVSGGHLFQALAVGTTHVCAIDGASAAWCWGLNDYGELGLTTSYCNPNVQFVTCSRVPMLVGGSHAFVAVAAAAYTSCGLDGAGAAWCWGWNDHGQLGTGQNVGVATATPRQVAGTRVFRSISLDVNHACGVETGGAVSCWGSNDYGQLAADTLLTPRCGSGAGFFCAQSPVVSAAGLSAQIVSAGSTHTCAVIPGGQAWCWGSNQYGVLGDAAAQGGRSPSMVSGGHAFQDISAGVDHTCGIDLSGAILCWGLNTDYQLGAVPATSACPAFGTAQLCATSPALVISDPAFSSVSAGAGHTCALTAGEIWCWGRGTEGQLGDHAGTTAATPSHVIHP